MKLIYFLSVLMVVYSSCKPGLSEREKELERKERELNEKLDELNRRSIPDNPTHVDNTSPYITPTEEPQSLVRYMYVVIDVNIPEVKTYTEQPPQTFTDQAIGRIPLIEEKHILVDKVRTFASDVIKIENFTEDSKYMAMDMFEEKLLREPQFYNFDPNVGTIKSTVVSREAYVFDSYAEASKSRSRL
jgi:hypothetical protein